MKVVQWVLKKDYLNNDVGDILLRLAPKTQDFLLHQHYNIITLSPKSKRAQYREGQKGRKYEKDNRDGENRKSERNREGYWGNKINSVVGEDSGFEISIYYHIIYRS